MSAQHSRKLNFNCEGEHCTQANSEVRLLPVGNTPDNGNMVLCHECYRNEIAYRIDRNKTLDKDAQFKLPSWKTLKIYHGC